MLVAISMASEHRKRSSTTEKGELISHGRCIGQAPNRVRYILTYLPTSTSTPKRSSTYTKEQSEEASHVVISSPSACTKCDFFGGAVKVVRHALSETRPHPHPLYTRPARARCKLFLFQREDRRNWGDMTRRRLPITGKRNAV